MEKVGAYTDRATESGEWRPGSPGSGQTATPMLSSYFNMLQRELVAVVEGSGLVLNQADDEQLSKAIARLIANASIDSLSTTRINVASAANINLTTGAPNTRHIQVTGTTTISGFTVAVGRCYFVRFAAALTLVNSASLVTPTGTNILTVAGDSCVVRATAANTVELLCFSSAAGVAAGEVATFARSAAPAGWLKANGAAVSRTTYGALFAAIGTTFGAGDGSTTFNLPDGRGEFFRGWDDGRAVDAGRALGSSQAGSVESHTHGYTSPLLGSNVVGSGSGTAAYHPTANAGVTQAYGSTETRPRNLALLACIKY